MIHVGLIGLDHRDHRFGGGKARQVVDMAVGVVTRNPAIQPDDFLDPEIVVKSKLVLAAAEAGIALRRTANSSVVSSFPAPLTSMLPPSSTSPVSIRSILACAL